MDDNSASTPPSSWRNSKTAKGMRSAGGGVSQAGQNMISDARDQAAANIHPVQYKRGGKVRRTGPAIVHKGERVIPKDKVRTVDRMMKKRGMKKRDSKRGER